MANLWPGLFGPHLDYISNPPSLAWQTEFPRKLVILGSTGSIGQNALKVIGLDPQSFKVLGLSCATRVDLLAKQANKWRPPYLAVLNDTARNKLKPLLKYCPEILVGPKGYADLASLDEATTVVSAQSGAAGLYGTVAAALYGKVLCLANKESLVLAGYLVRDLVGASRASILPIDSEHNALFQCLAGRNQDAEILLLTASGGPFVGKKWEDLQNVTPEAALKHPNWRMGKKITIDSATMMNKGLEIIEAFHLFGVRIPQIEVLVHPQSVVHSMVRFSDGSILGQFGVADMKMPIANCLYWPRIEQNVVQPLDFSQGLNLTFIPADTLHFPALDLAKQALGTSSSSCVVLNAANEVAVELFLAKKCAFTDIPKIIAKTLETYHKSHHDFGIDRIGHIVSYSSPKSYAEANLEVIENIDNQARLWARAAYGEN